MKYGAKYQMAGFGTLLLLVSVWVIILLVVTGCKPSAEAPGAVAETESNTNLLIEAAATLAPTEGHETKGTITFTQTEAGVRVVVNLTGLAPGEHGFHVHEKGDCSAPDASSAGDHFNPTGMPHGAPGSEQHHLGDLGNLTADASGTANYDRVFSFLELSGSNSIVGRAIIVHSDRDDLTSQPSGAAGNRIACGVIAQK